MKKIQHIDLAFCDYYQSRAWDTAIYPNKGNNLAYPTLGLVGETGEFARKCIEGASDSEIILELGDMPWYMAAVATEAGIKLSSVASIVLETGHPLDRRTCLEAFITGNGELSERVKKIIRDKDGRIDKSDATYIRYALSTTYRAFLSECAILELGVTPKQILEGNLDKLRSRAERGVLHGEGDRR